VDYIIGWSEIIFQKDFKHYVITVIALKEKDMLGRIVVLKILCEKGGQYFIITIQDKKILYYDKFEGSLWGGSLQYLPTDYANVMQKISSSRNKIPAHFKEFFLVSKEELMEYEEAKDDENKLKEIVLRDIKRNNCKIVDIKIT
jgi:hypothetical protein